MYQSIDDTDALDSEWKRFEGQQSFPEWQYITPDASSSGNLEWPSTYLTQERSPTSSNEQSTKGKGSPRLRETTPGTPSSTSTNNKEAAYSRRLSQNRKAQRAHRARQRQHVECLEEQLKTVVGKYEDLQQRYSSLSASYERLVKGDERNETGEYDEERWNSCPGWKFEEVHVTTDIWREDYLEDNQLIATNNWQRRDDRGGFV